MNISDMINDFGEALEPKNIRLSKSQKGIQEFFENLFILPELDMKTLPVTSRFVQAINMLICELQRIPSNNMFVVLTSDKLVDFFKYIQYIPDYILPEAVIYGFMQNYVDSCVDLFFMECKSDTRFEYNPSYFNPKYKNWVYETNRVIDRELRCKSVDLNNFTINVDGELVYKYGENYEHR